MSSAWVPRWRQLVAWAPAGVFFAGGVSVANGHQGLWPHQAFYWLAGLGVLAPLMVALVRGPAVWRVILGLSVPLIACGTLATTWATAHRADDGCVDTADRIPEEMWTRWVGIDLVRGEVTCDWHDNSGRRHIVTRSPVVDLVDLPG